MRILGIISIVMILCSLICGLWMKYKPGEGDVNFHVKLSFGTMVISLMTIVMYMVKM